MKSLDHSKVLLPFASASHSIRANTPVGRDGRFVRDISRTIRGVIHNRGFRNVSLSIRGLLKEYCDEID